MYICVRSEYFICTTTCFISLV